MNTSERVLCTHEEWLRGGRAGLFTRFKFKNISFVCHRHYFFQLSFCFEKSSIGFTSRELPPLLSPSTTLTQQATIVVFVESIFVESKNVNRYNTKQYFLACCSNFNRLSADRIQPQLCCSNWFVDYLHDTFPSRHFRRWRQLLCWCRTTPYFMPQQQCQPILKFCKFVEFYLICIIIIIVVVVFNLLIFFLLFFLYDSSRHDCSGRFA